MTIEAASKKDRTVSSEVMKHVAGNLAQDGFTLSPDIVGEWTVTKVIAGEYNGIKNFIAVLQREGHTINLPSSAIRGMRVLGSNVKNENFWEDNDGMVLRSKGKDVWDASQYLHSQDADNKMVIDDDYIVPPNFNIQYAILRDDPDNEGTPIENPFKVYNGFPIVFAKYQKEEPKRFPSVADLSMEMKKEGEARLPGLPVGTEPDRKVEDIQLKNLVFNLITIDKGDE